MNQLTKIYLWLIPVAAFLQLFKSFLALLLAAGQKQLAISNGAAR